MRSAIKPREIEVFRFQPFASRHGVDVVVGLRFRYDAEVITTLKERLAEWREIARHVCGDVPRVPGGWLPDWGCWWVEELCWPATQERLAEVGCTFQERQGEN